MSARRAGRDGRTLPLGLVRYQGRMFERLHASGNRLITASQVPALWNQSRFAGRYATVAHAAGKAPLVVEDNMRTMWGRYLEPVAAKMLAEQTGLQVRPIRAYARHRAIDGFLASPDTLLWDADGEPGIGELKVVHEFQYQEHWLDGPPLEVQLQHQAQFAATKARHGYIGALVWGINRCEFLAYPTEPNPDAIRLIEDDVREVLRMIAEDRLPDPDPHPTSVAALQTVFPGVIPNKSVQLAGDEAVEAERLFDEWEQIKARRSIDAKREKQIKSWMAMMAVDADELKLGADKSIRIKEVERAGYTVEPTTYRDYRLRNRAKSPAPQDNVREAA